MWMLRERKAYPMTHITQVWVTQWYNSLQQRVEEEQVKARKMYIPFQTH